MAKQQAKKQFQYQARTEQQVQTRALRKGGDFDRPFGDFPIFAPQDGDNTIRVLPPTWEPAEHFGLDVYLYYGCGPEKRDAYLAPSKMKGEADPFAEELVRAKRMGENDDYIKSLRPRQRVLVWVIDRAKEKEGPKLWSMPVTVDKEITACSMDKKTKEVLNIDNPEEGYDITFTKSGKGLTTEYTGVQAERRPSPLSDDDDLSAEWLAFITEHPLPSVLQFYGYEHLKAVLEGGLTAPLANTDDEEHPRSRSGKQAAKDENWSEEPAATKPSKGKPAPKATEVAIDEAEEIGAGSTVTFTNPFDDETATGTVKNISPDGKKAKVDVAGEMFTIPVKDLALAEEAPAKASKAPAVRARLADEEPAKPSKGKAAPKDDDEDEAEEEPAKPSKGKPGAKPAPISTKGKPAPKVADDDEWE